MKDKAIAYGLYIALGMVAVAIAAIILIPLIRNILNDAGNTRPTMPTPSASVEDLQEQSNQGITYSLSL